MVGLLSRFCVDLQMGIPVQDKHLLEVFNVLFKSLTF
jgi:hypothetical protein